MTVSLDHLHMLGAHLANTLEAIDKKNTPIWAVTLDDLRCFVELFDSPSIFLHFAKIRLRAASRRKVEVFDEMDHVGLYFKENDYVMQSEEFDAPLTRYGYAEIDRYFFGKGAGQIHKKPKQEMPALIEQLVAACDNSASVTSRELASLVLGSDSDTRMTIEKWIADQLANAPAIGRFRIFAVSFSSRSLSLMCSQVWTLDSIQQAMMEAKARLVGMAKVEHTLVALLQIGGESLVISSCFAIAKDNISKQELASLIPIRKAQEQRDFAGISSKIGRNDPCPCGSGLKFKRCHGR